MFIGRTKELAALERMYAQKGSSLTVVYGRRRLGKTTLLRRFTQDKPFLYFLATEESESENRKTFQDAAALFTGSRPFDAGAVSSWEGLFRTVAEQPTDRKKVIILDEFQYLGKANSAFPSILQRIWDMWMQDTNIMLILCGSLIHMMQSQALSYSSPLYGRRNGQIRLGPIPFSDYGGFYPDADPDQLLQLYSITGGVPKYAQLFQPRDKLIGMISDHILDPSSFLYDEPGYLLRREVTEVGTYFSVIKAIAAGGQKLGRIATRLGVPQSNLTRYLATLSDLDIVSREVPVTETSPEKSKKGLYRIKDYFLRFWFRFVFPYKTLLESGQPQPVLDIISRDLSVGHISWVYEDICRDRALQMSAGGDWPARVTRIGRWWSNNEEIDVVGIGENDVLFGECKYWTHPVGRSVLEKLKTKSMLVPCGRSTKDRYYALFSPAGFTRELTGMAEADDHIILSK